MLRTIVRKACKEETLCEVGELSEGPMPILGRSVSGRDKSMCKGPEQMGKSLAGFEYQVGASMAGGGRGESYSRGPGDGKVTGGSSSDGQCRGTLHCCGEPGWEQGEQLGGCRDRPGPR